MGYDYRTFIKLSEESKNIYERDRKAYDYKNQYVPDKLYKYTTLNNNIVHALLNNKVWFSDINFLNDPFEFQKYFSDDSISDAFIENNKKLKVLSLSSDPLNKLMWSHYANSYKGICIEYNVINKGLLFPVTYINSKQDFTPFIKLWEQYENGSDFDWRNDDVVKTATAISQINYIKDSEWAYENEVRAVMKSEDCNGILTSLYNNCFELTLSKIICGLKCPENEILQVVDIANRVSQDRFYFYKKEGVSDEICARIFDDKRNSVIVSKLTYNTDLCLQEEIIPTNWLKDLENKKSLFVEVNL